MRPGLVTVLLCLLLGLHSAPSAAAVDPGTLESAATHILNRVLEGIFEGDYEKYTSDFSDSMKKSMNRETFLQLQKKLRSKVGKFVSMEYLGFYNQAGTVIALFKARFSKGKDDVLISLVLDGAKRDPRVLGLWFDAPSLR